MKQFRYEEFLKLEDVVEFINNVIPTKNEVQITKVLFGWVVKYR